MYPIYRRACRLWLKQNRFIYYTKLYVFCHVLFVITPNRFESKKLCPSHLRRSMVKSVPFYERKESQMKDINVKTRMNLRKMNQLLVQYLEIANTIPEDDWKKIVLVSQKKRGHLRKIIENSERGNLFMILFFVRELIEALLNED